MTSLMARRPILLVNPVIFDFAAYDFWARPLGLFWVGGLLLAAGFEVVLLDCLDPRSPWLPAAKRPKRTSWGGGKFLRTALPHPAGLPQLNRRYSRYGLTPDLVERALSSMERPAAILVTSMMTYWYPGVQETIARLKSRWPEVPLLLGGVYATLCPEHARATAGADRVLPGPLGASMEPLGEILGCPSLSNRALDLERILPAHQLAPDADAAALLTSLGCPLRCTYCGVPFLHPRYQRFSPARIAAELEQICALPRVHDVALYDDAFLYASTHAEAVLEALARAPRPLRCHAASGLACRGLTLELARAMKRAGFATIRLGLETSDPQIQQQLGGKVCTTELSAALDHLAAAGFDPAQIGVYVMVGLPGQIRAEVERSIETVRQAGVHPHLAEYSPVPHSSLFDAACTASPHNLRQEPLYHNPTLLPCSGPELDRQAMDQLRLSTITK